MHDLKAGGALDAFWQYWRLHCPHAGVQSFLLAASRRPLHCAISRSGRVSEAYYVKTPALHDQLRPRMALERHWQFWGS